MLEHLEAHAGIEATYTHSVSLAQQPDVIISYPGKVDNFVSVDGPANVFSLSSHENERSADMVFKILKVYPASGHTNVYGRTQEVPQIRLQGFWVEKLGFTVDSKFKLFANDGVIILKSIKEV